jgi:hypothetical protein
MEQLIDNSNKQCQLIEAQKEQVTELADNELQRIGGGIVAFLL